MVNVMTINLSECTHILSTFDIRIFHLRIHTHIPTDPEKQTNREIQTDRHSGSSTHTLLKRIENFAESKQRRVLDVGEWVVALVCIPSNSSSIKDGIAVVASGAVAMPPNEDGWDKYLFENIY